MSKVINNTYLFYVLVWRRVVRPIVKLGRRWQPDQLPASVATMSLGGGNTAATQQSLAICHNIANLATGRFYEAPD